ncbi:Short-chain dehydrogenase/reductase SDR [Caballeronia udeis]|uniref:Peroxisomal trans-2-enoyl-CoA reductase n=1 Tax=Caballeronia udeis TaxID=1232866 RepID=A0A158JG04_9BURK|nr:SDR family oxidoreductase [Caballeronia udeis]SAL67399.1 Short-chain dehydrogenase/reductase SDR [Caballeronia udeis]
MLAVAIQQTSKDQLGAFTCLAERSTHQRSQETRKLSTRADAACSTARHAIRGLTQTAAIECAACGIRINELQPGVIDTGMTQGHPEGAQAVVDRGIPMRRVGCAEEVATAVCFLFSDEASYITGAHLAKLIPNKATRNGKLDPPWWDLPLRMVLIAGLVIGVTLIAPYVGPEASGVLASFPFMVIILAVFTHRMIGPAATQQLMRGVVVALPRFAAFFYVPGLTLTKLNLPAAYGGAILCTFAIQAVCLYRMRVPATLPVE